MSSLFLDFPIFFSERIDSICLPWRRPDFCLHFSTTYIHISDDGSRGSEIENRMSSERATEKPSLEGKQK